MSKLKESSFKDIFWYLNNSTNANKLLADTIERVDFQNIISSTRKRGSTLLIPEDSIIKKLSNLSLTDPAKANDYVKAIIISTYVPSLSSFTTAERPYYTLYHNLLKVKKSTDKKVEFENGYIIEPSKDFKQHEFRPQKFTVFKLVGKTLPNLEGEKIVFDNVKGGMESFNDGDETKNSEYSSVSAFTHEEISHTKLFKTVFDDFVKGDKDAFHALDTMLLKYLTKKNQTDKVKLGTCSFTDVILTLCPYENSKLDQKTIADVSRMYTDIYYESKSDFTLQTLSEVRDNFITENKLNNVVEYKQKMEMHKDITKNKSLLKNTQRLIDELKRMYNLSEQEFNDAVKLVYIQLMFENDIMDNLPGLLKSYAPTEIFSLQKENRNSIFIYLAATDIILAVKGNQLTVKDYKAVKDSIDLKYMNVFDPVEISKGNVYSINEFAKNVILPTSGGDYDSELEELRKIALA